MNLEKPIRVTGCPLCQIFDNPRENIRTKLYWPERPQDVRDSEFVILECETCKIPMIVYGEHVTSITREGWGRVLYRCRELFGGGITIRNRPRTIRDHYHCHVIYTKY
jgi:hypothetical protein